MSVTARETAKRVVEKLLNDSDEPQRPPSAAKRSPDVRTRLEAITGSAMGNPSKAWRTGFVPRRNSSQGAVSGGGGSVAKAWHTGHIKHKVSTSGARSGGGGSVAKAFKPGSETDKNGDRVAKPPGTVSYREALTRQVAENIKVKKAIKGLKKTTVRAVAKPPGRVHSGK